MVRSKEYVINVHPIGWKRAGLKHKRFYDTQEHDKLATGLYLLQQHGSDTKFTRPVHVDLVFHVQSPRIIKPGRSDVWCGTVPDVDNYIKFIFDSINDTKSIWSDDRIVCSVTAKKVYANTPRTHIIIKELE